MAKNALITGITGQDGSYLAELLLKKGYNVYGTFRNPSKPNLWRLQALKIHSKVHLIKTDLAAMDSILDAIRVSDADEIYNFAAQSSVSASFEQPIPMTNLNCASVVMFLEAIRKVSPDTKFYQASTSEMFGKPDPNSRKTGTERKPLNEESAFHPTSPYAASKIYAYWSTRIYREAYKLFACQGILFNHESPMRGLEFVTRKISNNVAKIHLGLEKELKLGNVQAARDWGYAPEYVDAMWRMMQHDHPDDFVIATGQSHSVSEFVEAAFNVVRLDSEKYVKVDKKLLRPIDIDALRGDYSKAREKLGWEPKTHFKELVEIMVKADVERWKMVIDGKSFPWDAPNYTEEAQIIAKANRK
jgi:GDPmannose 4,6-dehydratase